MHSMTTSELETIGAGREVCFRFFHGNKLWLAYAAYISDASGNLYFPVDEGTQLFKGIKKEAFVSAKIEELDMQSGEVVSEVEMKGEIVLLETDLQHWNDRFMAKYSNAITKEIAEMMLHKPWYTLVQQPS